MGCLWVSILIYFLSHCTVLVDTEKWLQKQSEILSDSNARGISVTVGFSLT